METENQLPHLLSPHRQQKRDAMVAKILETARAIMRTEGVAALSMQELARQLGLRAPSLYNYFSSKLDVYDTLFRLGFTLFDEHMAVAVNNAQTWQEVVRRYIEGYMSFAKQNPELYQLCFERPVPGFVPSEVSLQISFEMLRRAYTRMAAMLPQMETDLTEQQAADLIIAIMHGLTALHLANEPEAPAGEGRFGSLIPAVMEVLEKAWAKP